MAISGCGGGGGGDSGAAAPQSSSAPAPTLSPISLTSYNKVAGNAWVASEALGSSSSSVTEALAGVSIEGAKISSVSPALRLLDRAYNGSAPALLTGVTVMQSCAGGGTLTVEGTIQSSAGASNGDKLNISTVNCVEDGMKMNGGFDVTLSGISGTAFGTGVWAATIDAKFNAFTVTVGTESLAASGDMKIVLNQTSALNHSMATSGKSFQTSESQSGTVVATRALTDYSVKSTTEAGKTTSTADFAFSGKTATLGEFKYTVKNIQPLISIGDNPVSGSFIVTGATSSVTVTITATGVRLDYSEKGDGVITQIANYTWASFLSGI